jgi:hypothetical protein
MKHHPEAKVALDCATAAIQEALGLLNAYSKAPTSDDLDDADTALKQAIEQLMIVRRAADRLPTHGSDMDAPYGPG